MSRQAMMDDGLVYFADQARTTIQALDPTALVSIGFFWPQAPNPTRAGDERVIQPYPAIAQASIDFVGVHPYPSPSDLTLDQIMQNFAFSGYQQQKPVVMEEFGTAEVSYPTLADAAAAMKGWQIDSCTYDVKGWLLWTWDTAEADQPPPTFWNALSGDGEINQALAPVMRPDPCSN